MGMDVDFYLDRLGLKQRPALNEGGLAELMEAHILKVPFENFDIPLGLGVHLETDHLFEKIVTRRRGGYCFELNGLFGSLLDVLGFERYPVMARVWYRNPDEVPALTHTLNIVTLNGHRFMADVGFGGTTARVPVPLEDGILIKDADGQVTLRKNDSFGFMLSRETPEGLQDQFSTTNELAHPCDLYIANHYVSTHSNSHFTRMAVAGRFTPDGRIGLTDRTLTVRHGWEIETRMIEQISEYGDTLNTHFGITLGDALETIFNAHPQGEKTNG